MNRFNFGHPLIVLDLEMSGPDPSKHQITELAALKCDPNNLGIVDKFYQSFRAAPGKSPKKVIEEAHPVALEKTGLREKNLEFGLTPQEGVEKFKEWLPREYIFVGYNLMLDFMFLRKAREPEVRFNYRFIDVSTVVELYYGHESRVDSRNSYSLHNLANLLDISYEKSHSGMDDALLVQKIFKKLLKKM